MSRKVEVFLTLLLVVASVALTLNHASGDAATTDEPVHIASGYEIVHQGTGRWNPEHPPLAKALAGLALSFVTLDPPENGLQPRSRGPGLIRFVHQNRTPSESLLFVARLPFALALAALLLAVRFVARRFFGPSAGLLALALAAFEPNLIAHAGIVHTDLAVTLFFVSSLVPLSRLLEPPVGGARRAISNSVLLGILWSLMFLSKFNAPLLALASLPLAFVVLADDRPGRPRFHVVIGRLATRTLLAAAVAGLLVFAGYAVAYRSQSLPDCLALAKDRLLDKGRSVVAYDAVVRLSNVSRPAANAALGAASIILQSRIGAGVNYFCGRISREGSPLYFPVALATKISIGLFLATALGGVLAWTSAWPFRRARELPEPHGSNDAGDDDSSGGSATAIPGVEPKHMPSADKGGARRQAFAVSALALTVGLVIAASLRSSYNIGVRHVLFAFPLAAIAASSVLNSARSRLQNRHSFRGRIAITAWTFAALQSLEVLCVHPHELSFFNAFAGGVRGGRRLFVDSSLDWGQDLRRLADAAPALSTEPIPTVIFGGDVADRYRPRLRGYVSGDEDRIGRIIAIGEQPLAIGPEFYSARGVLAEAERLRALRDALRARGRRISEIGGSIAVYRIER